MQEKRACVGRVERGGDATAAWLTSFGHRPQQQDVALCKAPLYGIFDGHGPDGLLTAQRAAQLLQEHYAATTAMAQPARIVCAFERTQTDLLQHADHENIENGTTAALAFCFPEHDLTGVADAADTKDANGDGSKDTVDVTGEQGTDGTGGTDASYASTSNGVVLVATVGDSRVLLCRDGGVLFSSVDHDLTQAEERLRCEQHGGRVVNVQGCVRLLPPESEPALLVVKGARRLTLNMSRALGHRILSTYGVSAVPHLEQLQVRGGDRLVLASDGIWDVLPNDLVAYIVSYQASPSDACTAVFNEAMDTYALQAAAADNISIQVIFF